MRLTWKDAVATLFLGAVIAVFAAFMNGTSLWLISSARGATAVVLVLGSIGGRALGAVGDMYTTAQPGSAWVLKVIATTLGVSALAAAVTGLITGSAYALTVLVTATVAFWLVATIRHLFTTRPEAVHERDLHEVISAEQTAHR